jgi:hypothetical protein
MPAHSPLPIFLRDTMGTYEVPAGRGTRVPVLRSLDRR